MRARIGEIEKEKAADVMNQGGIPAQTQEQTMSGGNPRDQLFALPY
jgi:hypothetical protein